MYIVTGGCGFIGSNIIRALNKLGVDDIMIVDEYPRDERYKNLSGLEYKDIIEPWKFSPHAYSNIEGIFHQGAVTDTTASADVTINNFEMSRRMLTYCTEHGKKIVYASSASVYGNNRSDPNDKTLESPLNHYAYSKLAADNITRSLIKENGKYLIVGLRYFNVYGGKSETHKGKMASFIHQKIVEARLTGRIEYFAPAASRDFIHVDDVVNVNIHMMFNGTPSMSGIYDVGTGTSTPFSDVIFNITQHANVSAKIVDMPKDLLGKYQYKTEANISALREKARYALHFTDIKVGIGRAFTEINGG